MIRRRLKRPLAVTHILNETLRDLGLEVKLRQYRAWGLWDEVVGPAISAHAQPCSVRGGSLLVAVEDSLWLHQLNYLKHRILVELNERLGKAVLRDMVLRVGEVIPPSPAPMARLPFPESLSPSEEERMQRILSPIKDLPCREVVERVVLLHFCRKVSSP
jgi:hypothetical protein